LTASSTTRPARTRMETTSTTAVVAVSPKRKRGSILIDDMAVVDNESEEDLSDAETDDGEWLLALPTVIILFDRLPVSKFPNAV
jgi:hypothetical protein